MGRPYISIHGVEKTFAGNPPVHALTRINLEIGEGEFAAVLGPSGCGKSTLLDLIAGFETADCGEIRVQEQPVFGPGSDRAVVFQEPALFPWLSVWENVLFRFRIQGRVTPEQEARKTLKVRAASYCRSAHTKRELPASTATYCRPLTV